MKTHEFAIILPDVKIITRETTVTTFTISEEMLKILLCSALKIPETEFEMEIENTSYGDFSSITITRTVTKVS